MRQRTKLNTGYKVYTHDKLSRATENDIRDDPKKLLSDADQGIQTAIVASDGKTITSIVGLNGTRYLPDPDPDPLDEILRAALAQSAAAGQEKK